MHADTEPMTASLPVPVAAETNLLEAPAALAEFDRLVAQPVEQYRPPLGALVHPETVMVDDPAAVSLLR